MKAQPVSLAERVGALTDAHRRLEEAVKAWFEARAKGSITEDIEGELREALRASRRAESALERTRRRIEKAEGRA